MLPLFTGTTIGIICAAAARIVGASWLLTFATYVAMGVIFTIISGLALAMRRMDQPDGERIEAASDLDQAVSADSPK